jgi:aspartyl-tRNA(Asn)/glutamyl-tRNA(Gln) amidotransferase subunit C
MVYSFSFIVLPGRNSKEKEVFPTINYKPKTINYICPMEVNDALVDKLAHLAKLQFDDAEKEEIKNDLQRMIAFVEKLNELDLTGVEPMLHMSNEVNVLREDEIKGSISREEALKNAPLHDDKFFKVPKVIKK